MHICVLCSFFSHHIFIILIILSNFDWSDDEAEFADIWFDLI